MSQIKFWTPDTFENGEQLADFGLRVSYFRVGSLHSYSLGHLAWYGGLLLQSSQHGLDQVLRRKERKVLGLNDFRNFARLTNDALIAWMRVCTIVHVRSQILIKIKIKSRPTYGQNVFEMTLNWHEDGRVTDRWTDGRTDPPFYIKMQGLHLKVKIHCISRRFFPNSSGYLRALVDDRTQRWSGYGERVLHECQQSSGGSVRKTEERLEIAGYRI